MVTKVFRYSLEIFGFFNEKCDIYFQFALVFFEDFMKSVTSIFNLHLFSLRISYQFAPFEKIVNLKSLFFGRKVWHYFRNVKENRARMHGERDNCALIHKIIMKNKELNELTKNKKMGKNLLKKPYNAIIQSFCQ